MRVPGAHRDESGVRITMPMPQHLKLKIFPVTGTGSPVTGPCPCICMPKNLNFVVCLPKWHKRTALFDGYNSCNNKYSIVTYGFARRADIKKYFQWEY